MQWRHISSTTAQNISFSIEPQQICSFVEHGQRGKHRAKYGAG